jgi:zinc-finger of a C2HC-type
MRRAGPASVTCFICGRPYQPSSIGIHVRNCAKLFQQVEEKKPRSQRRPLPQAPPGWMNIVGVGDTSDHFDHEHPAIGVGVDYDSLNEAAAKSYKEGGLVGCEFCGRRFAPDRLEIHNRSCTAETPARPVGERLPGGGGGAAGAVATSPIGISSSSLRSAGGYSSSPPSANFQNGTGGTSTTPLSPAYEALLSSHQHQTHPASARGSVAVFTPRGEKSPVLFSSPGGGGGSGQRSGSRASSPAAVAGARSSPPASGGRPSSAYQYHQQSSPQEFVYPRSAEHRGETVSGLLRGSFYQQQEQQQQQQGGGRFSSSRSSSPARASSSAAMNSGGRRSTTLGSGGGSGSGNRGRLSTGGGSGGGGGFTDPSYNDYYQQQQQPPTDDYYAAAAAGASYYRVPSRPSIDITGGATKERLVQIIKQSLEAAGVEGRQAMDLALAALSSSREAATAYLTNAATSPYHGQHAEATTASPAPASSGSSSFYSPRMLASPVHDRMGQQEGHSSSSGEGGGDERALVNADGSLRRSMVATPTSFTRGGGTGTGTGVIAGQLSPEATSYIMAATGGRGLSMSLTNGSTSFLGQSAGTVTDRWGNAPLPSLETMIGNLDLTDLKQLSNAATEIVISSLAKTFPQEVVDGAGGGSSSAPSSPGGSGSASGGAAATGAGAGAGMTNGAPFTSVQDKTSQLSRLLAHQDQVRALRINVDRGLELLELEIARTVRALLAQAPAHGIQ